MTPKEKARELVDKFNLPSGLMSIERKQCALIAVDEVIKSLPSIVLVSVNGDEIEYPDREKYWQQVKQEIEAL